MAAAPVQEPGPHVRALTLAALDALHAENRAAAARLRACRKLYEMCDDEQLDRAIAAGYGPGLDEKPSYAIIDPLHVACAEIVAAYGVHHHRAKTLITLANNLSQRFPALLGAMEEGWLDEHTASLLARHMRTVDESVLGRVQRDVIDWLLDAISSGRRPGRDAILNHTDRIIGAHDPDGVLARRERALYGRNVRVRRSTDGMADLNAHLAATDAEAISEALNEIARAQKRQAFSGADLGRLRADALVDALLGTNDPSPSGPDPTPGAASSGGPLLAAVRPNITVLAPLGPNDEPEVYLPRGGPASIDALIALLSRSIGATISVPDAAPTAADSPHQARRYRLSAELARRIRLRDGTCRHPGCSVAADDCDIDHCAPFNHSDPNSGGLSIEANLMCLCRQHHRFKTFHIWSYRLARDGTLTITTSTGHTVTTEPAGPLAQWRHAVASDTDPPPDSRPRPWLSPKPQSTHWHRRAQHLVAERNANNIARHTPPRPEPDHDPPPF